MWVNMHDPLLRNTEHCIFFYCLSSWCWLALSWRLMAYAGNCHRRMFLGMAHHIVEETLAGEVSSTKSAHWLVWCPENLHDDSFSSAIAGAVLTSKVAKLLSFDVSNVSSPLYLQTIPATYWMLPCHILNARRWSSLYSLFTCDVLLSYMQCDM